MKREAGNVGQVDHVGVWVKTVDDTTISFGLQASQIKGRDVYWAVITYNGIGKQR